MKEVLDKYCQKSIKHSYETVYEKDFEKLRTLPINILEIGVHYGDSIKAWLEYFPNAIIYTIDTFRRVPYWDVPVLQDPRVVWSVCDSTSNKAKNLWSDVKFDIIIDDGLHTSTTNRHTFLNFFDKLKVGGAYYVEDVIQFNIITPRDRFKGSYREYCGNEFYARYGSIKNYNRMLETFRTKGKSVFIYDLRELSQCIDSCIIKITK